MAVSVHKGINSVGIWQVIIFLVLISAKTIYLVGLKNEIITDAKTKQK